MVLGILGGGLASYLLVSVTMSRGLAGELGPADFAWWLAGGAAALVLLGASAMPRFTRGGALVLGTAAAWCGVVAWGTAQGSYALPLLAFAVACTASVSSAAAFERRLLAPRP
jgi:hypothetical protein